MIGVSGGFESVQPSCQQARLTIEVSPAPRLKFRRHLRVGLSEPSSHHRHDDDGEIKDVPGGEDSLRRVNQMLAVTTLTLTDILHSLGRNPHIAPSASLAYCDADSCQKAN